MTVTKKPLLLLDVDGVLNGLVSKLPEGWKQGRFNGFQISWDPTVTERLSRLHRDGWVEIQWLTTWGHDADSMLAEPMGLPRGLKVNFDYFHARNSLVWWKLLHAQEVAEENPDRKIIWIDDDHGYDSNAISWIRANKELLLTIRPSLYVGLTHDHLDEVEEWIND